MQYNAIQYRPAGHRRGEQSEWRQPYVVQTSLTVRLAIGRIKSAFRSARIIAKGHVLCRHHSLQKGRGQLQVLNGHITGIVAASAAAAAILRPPLTLSSGGAE